MIYYNFPNFQPKISKSPARYYSSESWSVQIGVGSRTPTRGGVNRRFKKLKPTILEKFN
jgi:hypothetical protein